MRPSTQNDHPGPDEQSPNEVGANPSLAHGRPELGRGGGDLVNRAVGWAGLPGPGRLLVAANGGRREGLPCANNYFLWAPIGSDWIIPRGQGGASPRPA